MWAIKREPKYHFIHIPKNGGNSVRKALQRRGDVSFTSPYHYRYVDVAEELGANLRYFSLIRNPWARTASRYLFVKKTALKWPEDDERRQYILNASFEQFVTERTVFDLPQHPGQPWMGPLSSWFDQMEWLRDAEGRIVVDALRLESVDEDLAEYFGKKMSLSRQNANKQPYSYEEMYTDHLAQLVADVFKHDIEYFGFSFQGGATQNTYCA